MFSGFPDIVEGCQVSRPGQPVLTPQSARYLPSSHCHPSSTPVMRLLPKKNQWKKLSAKTKKLISKMIPVQENIFHPIPWNRSSQSLQCQQDPSCNLGNVSTERKNIYLNPFKRIAARLNIKQIRTNEIREIHK